MYVAPESKILAALAAVAGTSPTENVPASTPGTQLPPQFEE